MNAAVVIKNLAILLIIIGSLQCYAEENFSAYKERVEARFRQHEKDSEKEFQEYRERIETLWNEFRESTRTQWVEYYDNDRTRTIVDFEKGEIIVETTDLPKDGSEIVEAGEKLAESLKKVIESKDETGVKILSGQLKGDLEQSADKKAVVGIVRKKITEVPAKQGVSYRVKVKLKSDHLKVRAGKYIEKVEKLCKANKLSPALVMGIIHVESYFNPKAFNRKSGAVGLMQIVPKYAGRTMNKLLNSSDATPSKSSLYNPDTNLRMGIGYLAYMEKRFFGSIKNVKSRYYCMICGYNSGPGTVLKLFTGVKKANNKFNERVNSMESSIVYKELKENIPYRETREYLIKVREKSSLYGNF